jgi:uncharacterized DUF497 family protein
MRFEWDPAKRRRNLRDHSIDFVDAALVFDGPTWERVDAGAYREERRIAVGVMRGIEITVVYTDRRGADHTVRRTISARRATRNERETFYRDKIR